MSPRQQEKLFLPEYAHELIRIAKGDLDTAKALQKSDNIRLENAFFMVQQCIEKSLKAVLVANKIPVPLVHDIGVILAKLPNELNSSSPYGYELSELNQYASIRRYEEGSFTVSKDDLSKVITLASEMLKWCQDQIHIG